MSIEIVDYRESWRAEFNDIGTRLRGTLGAIAIRICHIGSTSVPGLAAKDVIDIQVSVESLDFSAETKRAFSAAGYPLRDGPRTDHVPAGASPDGWTKRMAGAAPGARRTHVHIRRAGAPNERYPLLFRDYLRANRSAATTYGLIKRALAEHHADDVDAYYAVKDPVCDLIIDAAERWALASNWTLPASDA